MTGSPLTTESHQITISPVHLAEMVEHVREWFPFEGCGLLGTDGDRVVKVYRGNNIARSQTFYEMDPKQVLQAMNDIDKQGIRLGAIFHSHPATQAYPSPTDLELIFDPSVYMIIISLAGDEPDVRAFRYDSEIIEVPIIINNAPEGDQA